jgi:hypothetical protein
MTTSDPGAFGAFERESLEDQLRRKSVQPIQSADSLACDGLFESDEELEAFLKYTYESRHAELT